MKRGKDDEKILEPMFPRLHVNDADKGGPRAPPRNKMALYEQLSIPSQRFGDHGNLSLSSRSNNTSTLVHPGPSNQQSCGVERNLSVQHLDSSAAVHVTENFVSQMPFMENMRSLAKHDQRKTVREEDDFAVPVFVNSRRFQSHGSTKSGIVIEKHTTLATCSKLVRDKVKMNAKSGGFIDLSSTEEVDLEKSASSYDRVNDCNSSLRQESRNKLYRDGGEAHMKDTANRVESHLVTESHSEEGHGSPDDDDNGHEYCRSRGGVSLQQINEDARDDISDNSMVDSISSIDVSPDDVVGALGQKRFWRARKAITKEGHSLLTYIVQGARRDSSWLYTLVFFASACWNMSLSRQQRVFAVQLFELHRLIKVQRLIAASPDIVLDEINYLGKVSAKSYPVKKLVPSEFIVKPPLPQVVVNKQHRSDSEKTDQHKMECSAENVVGRLSNQGHHHNHQPSNYMPFPSNPPASPAVNGCCYPPQPPPSGNQQWLIPVMSPSEGLIYKPHPGMGHTGHYGGYYGHFMPPPMVMPPFHPGMGFPPPGNGYFPPYGVIPAMMNPYGPGQQQQQQPQANEQTNQFGYSGNLQNNTHQESSVNEAAPPQEPLTKSYPRARKSRQVSTASSASGREGISGSTSFRPFSAVDEDNNDNNNDAPDQMMTTTTTTTRTTVTQTTRDGGEVTRVIKVVPHNAKLASENAARIFRSIQEERKQHYDFSNL